MWSPILRPGKKALLALVVFILACSAERDSLPPQSHQSITSPSASRSNESATTEEITQEIRKSSHAELDCSDCHAPAEKDSPSLGGEAQPIGKADCGHCHELELRAYEQSVHAQSLRQGKTGAASCGNCHGSHFILPASDPRSQIFKRNLPETCGGCHKNPEVAKELGIKRPHAVQFYLDSLHGKALVQNGLLAAPTCTDCHSSSHEIRRASDPLSTVNRNNIPQTCGRCHIGPMGEYALGIHGKKLAEGNQKAPVCSDCHTAHQIVGPTGKFKLASDALCGKCHLPRLRQYLQTYHGRAHDLGSQSVAACFDCHGTHTILPASDPNSTLSVGNRLTTCQKCHADATAQFTSYRAHADYRDRQHYPVLYWAFVIMTGLIVGTFGLWGLHTLFWISRTLVVYFKNPAEFLEKKRYVRDECQGKLYTRFRPVDRFCHFLIIISFLILVSTGMPLKFHDSAWAKAMFNLLGGAHVAARLHRFGAILSLTYLTIHLSSLIGPVRRRWASFRDERGKFRIRSLLRFIFGPDSPMPNFD